MVMSRFKGVEVFEVFPNGCLNGIWIDDNPLGKNEVYNEIAKKKSGDSKDKLVGKYLSSFMDFGGKIVVCDLEIQPIVKNIQYQFIWKWDGYLIEGLGWRTRESQITVSFEYD